VLFDRSITIVVLNSQSCYSNYIQHYSNKEDLKMVPWRARPLPGFLAFGLALVAFTEAISVTPNSPGKDALSNRVISAISDQKTGETGTEGTNSEETVTEETGPGIPPELSPEEIASALLPKGGAAGPHGQCRDACSACETELVMGDMGNSTTADMHCWATCEYGCQPYCREVNPVFEGEGYYWYLNTYLLINIVRDNRYHHYFEFRSC
jgi:hypothetical protein